MTSGDPDTVESLPGSYEKEASLRINCTSVIAEIRELFERYEGALLEGDVDTLVDLFWNSPHTVRYGFSENGYGAAEISLQRHAADYSSGPKQERGRLEIMAIGSDLALVNMEFIVTGSGNRGRQSQTWVRFPEFGWKVVSAHVSQISNSPESTAK